MNSIIFGIKAVVALWSRNAKVWFKWLYPSIAGNIVNPILYFFSFGFGLGAVIETMDGVPYAVYIVPGMMCYAAMFSAGFETTIGSYFRMTNQGTFDAILATPVNLHQLLIGEILWATTKALLAAGGVMLAAYVFGAMPNVIGTIYTIPVLVFGSIAFAISGLIFTAYAKTPEFFNYFFTFWVTPNFLFTGVFFPINKFSELGQTLANLMPMTHFINITRDLTLGKGFSISMLEPVVYLTLLSIICYVISYKKLKTRLFS